MKNHTPGPWRVGDAGATVFGPRTDSPSPKAIATVSIHAIVGEENKANARLIAAAPELLAKLKENHLPFIGSTHLFEKCGTCKLVAKAEGK